jgi:hypothetical protein
MAIWQSKYENSAPASGETKGCAELRKKSVHADHLRSGDDVKVVRIDVPVKVAVATRLRVLIRLMPQIPCPVVHPFAIFVPSPTKNPPRAWAAQLAIGISSARDRGSSKALDGKKKLTYKFTVKEKLAK